MKNHNDCGFYCNKKDEKLCILKNKVMKPRDRRCLIYFIENADGVNPQTRLKYHNMHKKRFYSSLAFFMSAVSLIISLIVLFITL